MEFPLLRWNFLDPFEIAFGPGVNQPQHENGYKQQDLHEGKGSLPAFDPTAKSGGDGKDESDLDFEDDKNQRDDIKTDVEVDPRAAGRRLAALVSRELARLGVV